MAMQHVPVQASKHVPMPAPKPISMSTCKSAPGPVSLPAPELDPCLQQVYSPACLGVSICSSAGMFFYSTCSVGSWSGVQSMSLVQILFDPHWFRSGGVIIIIIAYLYNANKIRSDLP